MMNKAHQTAGDAENNLINDLFKAKTSKDEKTRNEHLKYDAIETKSEGSPDYSKNKKKGKDKLSS